MGIGEVNACRSGNHGQIVAAHGQARKNLRRLSGQNKMPSLRIHQPAPANRGTDCHHGGSVAIIPPLLWG